MLIPCDKRVACECTELPLTNYSSEDPDRFFFLSRRFRPNVPPPINFDPGRDPDGCVTFGSSTTSQDDADLCAARQEAECENNTSVPDPCEICTRHGTTPSGPPGSPSWTWLIELCTDATGQVVPCPDPCCDPDAPQGCCCHTEPDDPNIPDNPPGVPPRTPPGPTLFGNLPQTCSVECPDGSTNSFTVRAGYFVASSVAQANAMAYSYACQQAQKHKLCLGDLIGEPCLDVFFDKVVPTIRGSLVTSPLTFAVTNGALPSGLQLNFPTPPDGTSFRISGTPSATGAYSFTITATAASGESHSRDYLLEVYGSTCPGDGVLCTTYADAVSFYPPTISGGIVSMSGLPCGLSCSPSGVVTGTPFEDGTIDIVVTVTGNGRSCSRNCTMTIAKNPTHPTESASFSNLEWTSLHYGTPGHEGSGSSSGGGASASVSATSEDWDVGCQGYASNQRITSGIMRNCGPDYFATVHVEWSLSNNICTLPGGPANSTGQIQFFITGVPIVNQLVGGVNPYSGSFDYTFFFPTTPALAPGALNFVLDGMAAGGKAVMNASFSISPANPPPC